MNSCSVNFAIDTNVELTKKDEKDEFYTIKDNRIKLNNEILLINQTNVSENGIYKCIYSTTTNIPLIYSQDNIENVTYPIAYLVKKNLSEFDCCGISTDSGDIYSIALVNDNFMFKKKNSIIPSSKSSTNIDCETDLILKQVFFSLFLIIFIAIIIYLSIKIKNKQNEWNF